MSIKAQNTGRIFFFQAINQWYSELLSRNKQGPQVPKWHKGKSDQRYSWKMTGTDITIPAPRKLCFGGCIQILTSYFSYSSAIMPAQRQSATLSPWQAPGSLCPNAPDYTL